MSSDIDVDAGKLNRRMTLQQDIGTTKNLSGDRAANWQNWTVLSECWVGLEQLSGREIERAAMLNVEATHKITMRYVPGLTAVKFRGVIGGRNFQFGIVNDVLDCHVKLEIIACERIA